jgi:hypothetical protein
MRTRSLIISAILISALVLALAVIAVAADNPFVGTWKMIPAKSNGTTYKSYTIKIESRDPGFSAVQDIVNVEGKVIHTTQTSQYDGEDYSIKGSLDSDAMCFTKPDPNTVDYIVKKNGKEIQRGQAAISKDGKTWTEKGGGKDAKGQAFSYTIVMEKQ